jgi:hypothetical protein
MNDFLDSGGLLFGGNSKSHPRLLNLDPDKKRDLFNGTDSPDGPGTADHYAGTVTVRIPD